MQGALLVTALCRSCLPPPSQVQARVRCDIILTVSRELLSFNYYYIRAPTRWYGCIMDPMFVANVQIQLL